MPRTPRNTVLYGAIGQGGYQQKKGSRGEHCREHRGTALTMEACRLNHGSWRGGFPPGTPPSNCIDRSTPRRAKDRAASTRRLHEVLKGALEEADNEGKPAEETDEESEEEGELVLLDSGLEKETERDTKEE